MSATTISQKESQERLSVLLVLGVVILSLLLGTLVKNRVQNQTRPFSRKGVTAEIPTGWLVQNGTGDLVLVARNAQALDQLYRVNVLDGGALTAVANQNNSFRAGIDSTFRVVEETPIIVRGREGYKVVYGFVQDEQGSMPTVIEGVDYYFDEGDAVLVISYEADVAEFEEGVSQFQTFRASVNYQGGN